LLQNSRNTLIPDAVIDRLENTPDPEQEGIDICAELMRDVVRMITPIEVRQSGILHLHGDAVRDRADQGT